MSIVEKAMLHLQAHRPVVQPAAPAADVPEAVPPQPSAPPPVANAPPVAIRKRLALDQHPDVARDFRFLKRPVLARLFGSAGGEAHGARSMMITSDLPRAGKSFVSCNLAASMALEKMLRVLLVDADPVRRALSTEFGAESRPGLMELIAGEVPRLSDVMLATDVDSLYFLPAGQGRADATELMASARMSDLLRSLDDPNLVVLLDSPPMLLSSEGRVLAGCVHQVLVVVEAGRSTATEVGQVLELLRGSSAAVNLVINKTPAPGALRHHEYYNLY